MDNPGHSIPDRTSPAFRRIHYGEDSLKPSFAMVCFY